MPEDPANIDRGDEATRFKSASSVLPDARGNRNLSKQNRAILDQAKQYIRDNQLIYVEEMHNLAMDSSNPELQFQALKFMIERGQGKAVETLLVANTGEMSREEAAAVLSRHGLQAMLPKAREVVDEVKP